MLLLSELLSTATKTYETFGDMPIVLIATFRDLKSPELISRVYEQEIQLKACTDPIPTFYLAGTPGVAPGLLCCICDTMLCSACGGCTNMYYCPLAACEHQFPLKIDQGGE